MKSKFIALLISLVVVEGAYASSSPVYDKIHKCDELAADPHDVKKWAAGVASDQLASGAAIKYCRDAVKSYPGTVRFHFQLGRAYFVAGEYDKAIEYLKTAGQYNYAPAVAYLGDFYQYGIGGLPQDETIAWQYYVAAAEEGYLPAAELLEQLEAESGQYVFDPSGYARPDILTKLYEGRFKELEKTRYQVLIYVSTLHGFFSENYNFHDPSCILVYQPKLNIYVHEEQKRIMYEVIAWFNGTPLPTNGYSHEFKSVIEEIKHKVKSQFQSGQSGQIPLLNVMWLFSELSIRLGVYKKSAEIDAVRLTHDYGCQSEILKRIYDNAVKFVARKY